MSARQETHIRKFRSGMVAKLTLTIEGEELTGFQLELPYIPEPDEYRRIYKECRKWAFDAVIGAAFRDAERSS